MARRPGKATPGPAYGGLAARTGTGPLWKFTEYQDGAFTVPSAQFVSGLNFPLCNLRGMKSSVTPDLKGDLCADFSRYLTMPIVTEDFHRCNYSRNFWVTVPGREPWSATGTSAFAAASQWTAPDETFLEAGIGWFSVRRTSARLGLEATATVFVPSSPNLMELMRVEVRNIGRKAVRFVPTSATPIFGRPADNLRDHHQVTTMFNQVRRHKYGVVVKPRLIHDETGHQPNTTSYAVLAWTAQGHPAKEVWLRLRDFCGEGGSAANPEAVFRNLAAPNLKPADTDGCEAIGAMRFDPVTLRPGTSASWIVCHGITNEAAEFAAWLRKFGSDGFLAAGRPRGRTPDARLGPEQLGPLGSRPTVLPQDLRQLVPAGFRLRPRGARLAGPLVGPPGAVPARSVRLARGDPE
jgi:hypothetical protein